MHSDFERNNSTCCDTNARCTPRYVNIEKRMTVTKVRSEHYTQV